MVSKAREDFPEPETPVTTVMALCGTSKSIFLRLCTRAPRTTIFSWADSDMRQATRTSGSRRTRGGQTACFQRKARNLHYKLNPNRYLSGEPQPVLLRIFGCRVGTIWP